MKIEIMTKNQVRIEVAKVVEKREFKTLRLINNLSRRITKMEEEVNHQRINSLA